MFPARGLWKSIVLTSAVLAAPACSAGDEYFNSSSFEFATGRSVQMVRVGLQRDFSSDWRWFASNGSHLGGYWDLTAAYWRGNAHHGIQGQHQTFGDVGFTPVFRWQRDDHKGWYGEGAIGLHYLGDRYDNGGHQMSTKFEFGDHIGAGYVFDNGVDVGMKIQHFSNGGMKHPNGGVNFIEAKVSVRF